MCSKISYSGIFLFAVFLQPKRMASGQDLLNLSCVQPLSFPCHLPSQAFPDLFFLCGSRSGWRLLQEVPHPRPRLNSGGKEQEAGAALGAGEPLVLSSGRVEGRSRHSVGLRSSFPARTPCPKPAPKCGERAGKARMEGC